MATLKKTQLPGTETLFAYPILEKLTRWPIGIPITLFVIYAVGLAVINCIHSSVPFLLSVLLFFLGWITFSWVEYQVHRQLFHIAPITFARRKFQFLMHGVHHVYPKDKDRLAMPAVLSISIATLLLFVLRLLIGDFVFAFLPGFFVGYAFYLLIHYIVHIHPAPKNLFRYLWINHAIHHYKNDKIMFGVSSPLWDYVHGTLSKN
jgi:sterol desaturase/sphingolipid hydroxylase (fatty acid hydroxylase superfamily)